MIIQNYISTYDIRTNQICHNSPWNYLSIYAYNSGVSYIFLSMTGPDNIFLTH